ncbi:phytoene/squalene synthase family protein [Nocardia farcinica]|uniref:phytoene/squalene synthase family protein n=1 Tax=Nocardia farcinica TaxID=37329 RepID=UPI001894F00B|nr:phytoene/squalene synthase family protein [Nocardia farcinica]MBF6576043.1 phytoene/squalene synthase family protein [Nocardia farcinica]
MTRRELDAAGITDPALRHAYTRCRALNAAHGRTYFLATRLLPPDRRPAVHALYGFARYVDDLVDLPDRDAPGSGLAADARIRAHIDTAERELTAALAQSVRVQSVPAQPVVPGQPVVPAQPVVPGQPVASAQPVGPGQPVVPAQPIGPGQPVVPAQPIGPGQPVVPAQPVVPGQPVVPAQPVVTALADTVRRHRIDPALFAAFLTSMRMDLEVRDYPTRAALQRYTYGSAQVIGLQLLPVLGTVTDTAVAAPFAAALGDAFQLTNFLRDVAEDLDRGRVYLPADELAAHGVDRDRLAWCRTRGRPDAAVRAALTDQIAMTRAVYRTAEPGIALLDAMARPCVTTAFRLYAAILDRIEAADHNVFATRATVGRTRKLGVALPALTRAWWSRRPTPRHTAPPRAQH